MGVWWDCLVQGPWFVIQSSSLIYYFTCSFDINWMVTTCEDESFSISSPQPLPEYFDMSPKDILRNKRNQVPVHIELYFLVEKYKK